MGDNIVLAGFVLLLVASAGLIRAFFRRQRARPRRTAGDVLLGNALLLLGLGSLILACGECWYRFVHDASDAYGMARTSTAWFERHWKLNARGVRDSEEVHPSEKPPEVRRITFIGDSFTAGHGVADVDRRFANLVRRRHREWQVDVFAVNGWDTGDEIGGVTEIASHGYQLDVVVLVYNINDVADLTPLRYEIVERSGRRPSFLFQHSFLLNTLWVRWTVAHDPVLANYYGSLLEGYAGEAWQEQEQGLRRLQDVVEQNRGRLLVVTFPMLDRLGPEYPYREAHAKLDAHWRAAGVPQLDLLAAMEARRDEELIVSRRDPHPNERAHEIAADAIEAFLREQIERAAK